MSHFIQLRWWYCYRSCFLQCANQYKCHKFRMINNRPAFWLIYLLTYSDSECALLGSRRWFSVDGLVWTWVSVRKIEFWWKICMFLKIVEQKNIMEFPNKGCEQWGLKKLLKKLLKTGTTTIDGVATLKAYRISLVFLFCNIRTQTRYRYYKKGIHHLVANFLSCNNTKCY